MSEPLRIQYAKEIYNVYFGYFNDDTMLPKTATAKRCLRVADWLLKNFKENPRRLKNGRFAQLGVNYKYAVKSQ